MRCGITIVMVSLKGPRVKQTHNCTHAAWLATAGCPVTGRSTPFDVAATADSAGGDETTLADTVLVGPPHPARLAPLSTT